MDMESRVSAAIDQDSEASSLFAWLGPAHRAEFLDFIHGEAPEGMEERLAQAVAILAGRDCRLV
jgi:hypothetical protein